MVKNSQENIKKIVEVTYLLVDWDWLQEHFPQKHIIKREIKDADGDLFSVDFPKHLKDGDTLYITFACSVLL